MSDYVARRIDSHTPRWTSPKEMAAALRSRHLMTLYFDDQEYIGGMFGGWSEGIASCGWEFAPRWVSKLAQPPSDWFHDGDVVRPAPQLTLAEFSLIAIEVIDALKRIDPELAQPAIVAESLYERFGFVIDSGLVDDDTRRVSWATEIVSQFVRHGVSPKEAGEWAEKLLGELARLAAIRVRPRFQLFPYQSDALSQWSNGRRGILNLPTATGKTVIAIAAMGTILAKKPTARILVLVPSRLLAAQWYREVRRLLYLNRIVVRQTLPESDEAGIWIATQQQALSEGPAKWGRFDLMVVDEVHRSLGEEETGFGRLVAATNAEARLGLSASIPEGELTSAIGPVVQSLTFAQAVERGYLPKFQMTFTPCPVSEQDRREYLELSRRLENLEPNLRQRADAAPDYLDWLGNEGEFSAESFLEWAQAHPHRMDDFVKDFLRTAQRREQVLENSRPKVKVAAAEINEGLGERVGFVMADLIDFAEAIYQDLKGVPGVLAHSAMPVKDRDEALERFRTAQRRIVLVAAKIADEGLDVPQASMAFSVASPRTMTNLVQRLGRILRQAPNKPEPIFRQFESIPEWAESADQLSKGICESVVARFTARAQAALSLGIPLSLQWPRTTTAGDARFEEARRALSDGKVTSGDPAVGRIPYRLKAARRAQRSESMTAAQPNGAARSKQCQLCGARAPRRFSSGNSALFTRSSPRLVPSWQPLHSPSKK